MFCGTCGNQLREGARFCDRCGAVQQAMLPPLPEKPKPVEVIQPVLKVPPKTPKPKKQRNPANKKHLVIAAAVLIVAVLAAVLMPILFPGTETVYVMTSLTYTASDGTVYTYDFAVDEFGNPTKWAHPANPFEADYDKFGNLTEYASTAKPYGEAVAIYRVDYDYDQDGRIESAEKTFPGSDSSLEYAFTWDKSGNLTQILPEGMDITIGICRMDFVYDRQNRLIREYHIRRQLDRNEILGEIAPYTLVLIQQYTYDSSGKVILVEQGECRSKDEADEVSIDELKYDLEPVFELDYDETGRLTALTYCREAFTDSYSYDSEGNLIFADCKTTYDRHGNLIRLERENGVVYEYTYEPVKLSHEAAQRYRHSARYYGFDPIARELYPPGYPAYDFYYLIPNPIR